MGKLLGFLALAGSIFAYFLQIGERMKAGMTVWAAGLILLVWFFRRWRQTGRPVLFTRLVQLLWTPLQVILWLLGQTARFFAWFPGRLLLMVFWVALISRPELRFSLAEAMGLLIVLVSFTLLCQHYGYLLRRWARWSPEGLEVPEPQRDLRTWVSVAVPRPNHRYDGEKLMLKKLPRHLRALMQQRPAE